MNKDWKKVKEEVRNAIAYASYTGECGSKEYWVEEQGFEELWEDLKPIFHSVREETIDKTNKRWRERIEKLRATKQFQSTDNGETAMSMMAGYLFALSDLLKDNK